MAGHLLSKAKILQLKWCNYTLQHFWKITRL